MSDSTAIEPSDEEVSDVIGYEVGIVRLSACRSSDNIDDICVHVPDIVEYVYKHNIPGHISSA